MLSYIDLTLPNLVGAFQFLRIRFHPPLLQWSQTNHAMIVCSILISARSYPFTLSSCAISSFFPLHKDNQFTSVSGFTSVGIQVVFGSSNLLRELIKVQIDNITLFRVCFGCSVTRQRAIASPPVPLSFACACPDWPGPHHSRIALSPAVSDPFPLPDEHQTITGFSYCFQVTAVIKSIIVCAYILLTKQHLKLQSPAVELSKIPDMKTI